jgi:predicted MPP superfamily phosphohydrolase
MKGVELARVFSILFAFGLHVLGIWLIPGEIRQLFVEIIRESISSDLEDKMKGIAVSAGLAGIIFLTISTTFKTTVTWLSNMVLDEARGVSISLTTIIFLSIFLLVFGIGFFSHHYETTAPQLDSSEEEIANLAE